MRSQHGWCNTSFYFKSIFQAKFSNSLNHGVVFSLNCTCLFATFLVNKGKPCKIIHELPMWQVPIIYSVEKYTNQTICREADLKALIVAVVSWRMLSTSILYTLRRNCGFLFQGVVQETTPQKSAKIIRGVLFPGEYWSVSR